MELSSLFYFGALLKNAGLIVFLGTSVFVIYLAFQDTKKRGLFCLIPPYHMYYAMERMRHPWKQQINRLLFYSFLVLLLGLVFTAKTATYTSVGSSLVNGVAQGSYYALMAFAIILIFKTTDLVNFAQADMGAVCVFFLLQLLGNFTDGSGYPDSIKIVYGLGILLTLIFSGAFGIFTEMIFVKPIQKQHPITQIILTLGLSMMFANLGGIIWDLDEHTLVNILGGTSPNVSLGAGIHIAKDGLLSIGVTIVLMVIIFSLFKYTLLGIALRATAQSQTTSRLMGINVNRVFILSWAVSIILGFLAALFAFAGKQVSIYGVGFLLLKGFAAAILGGFSSMPGAVIGGFLLGIVDSFLGLLTNMKEALSFLIILLVLIIKPEGLLGKNTKKV